MIDNKINRGLNRAFHILFFITFGWVLLNVVGSYTAHTFVYITGGVLLALATAGMVILMKKEDCLTFKKVNIIFAIFFGVMIIGQLYMGYSLQYNPGTDLGSLHAMAKSFGETGDFHAIYNNTDKVSQGYLARYNNNFGIFILLGYFYRFVYLIFGRIPLMAPILLNILAIDVAVLFTFLIAKKIFKKPAVIALTVLMFIFVPFYTYTAYFYTDSLSIPFAVIPIYLFLCAVKSQKRVVKYIQLFFCGALILIGYELKGSLLILLLGTIIYTFLTIPIKRALAILLAVVAGFGSFYMVFNLSVKAMSFTSEEELYEQQYPLTHWIMMGLNGNGGFNQKDSTFTRKSGNYDEKKAANIAEIKNRLSEMGVTGLYDHLMEKSLYTWADGNYYIEHHLEDDPIYPDNLPHKFFLKSGQYYNWYYLYSNGFHIFMLLLIMVSILAGCIKSKVDIMTLLKGLIFAVFIFFLIWEARSRYIFNLTPIYLLVATDGLTIIGTFIKKFIDNKKLKAKTTKAQRQQ